VEVLKNPKSKHQNPKQIPISNPKSANCSLGGMVFFTSFSKFGNLSPHRRDFVDYQTISNKANQEGFVKIIASM
jgi:hypothetical protein